MAIPLPATLGDRVAKSQSLSLRFDRGYDGYDEKWEHRGAVEKQPGGKTSFLDTFVADFNKNAKATQAHERMMARRNDALLPLKPVSHTSTSALIVGIGRWNPVETGFTFDRLTGSPFLPGSSVKGLLRAAAELVLSGELQGDNAFWTRSIERIFGQPDQQGAFLFYDAYPEKWPELEVDIMTPHHTKYYDGGKDPSIAADWDEPVPVAFLHVKAGTPFLFWFGPRKPTEGNDVATVASLLSTALDWLGAGAKTSSGYGWFESTAGLAAIVSQKPAPPEPQRVEWQRAILELEKSSGDLKALYGTENAFAKAKDIGTVVPAELLALLNDKSRRKQLLGTVVVERFGNRWKIVHVRNENT